jgi:hypothetical protein
MGGPKAKDPAVRFMSFVDVMPDGCWRWTGNRDKQGYARFQIASYRSGTAHRWGYEHFVGKVPEGLELDHLCNRVWCVNPKHLEPVTRAENMRRRYALLTHCVNGHEFTPENTYFRSGGQYRDCRACGRDRQRRYRERLVAA